MMVEPRIAKTVIETYFGEFDFYCFNWGEHEEDNILCLKRDWKDVPICRIQSACYTAEIFRSLDCDCHAQLEQSLKIIQDEGGLFIYMLCDGRGAGLYQKTHGLELTRTQGLDTSDAYRELGLNQDPRDYHRPSFVLQYFQINKLRLLTNNPRKISGLQSEGLNVKRIPLEIPATIQSFPYLLAKRTKMGHLLSQFDES
jgi:GTP cyclohydrolase II